MWGDLALRDVPPDAVVVFVREGAALSRRALAWFELAHHTTRAFYAAGGRREIAGAAVGCRGEQMLPAWWAHRVGPLNDTCAFSPIRHPDDAWAFFVAWFAARRREWVAWPHVWNSDIAVPTFWKGRNKRNRDPQLKRFGRLAGTDYSYVRDKRLMWERWFPRWAANYTMRVVTAESNLGITLDGRDLQKSAPPPLPAANVSNMHLASTAYGDVVSLGSVWYEPVDREFGDGYFNALKTIVGHQQHLVSLTIVNSKFMELTRSWLCNVQEAGFAPPNIYWITLDKQSKTELDAIGVGQTVDITDALSAENMDPVNILYGQPAYWKLMLMRTRLIRDLLDRGIDVFLFETDQVWLQNPFDYFKKELDGGADMIGTLDTQHNVAGNTILLRSVLSTRRMWGEVYLRFKISYDTKDIESKEMQSNTFVEHDQYQLSDLLLFNTEFTQDFPVALGLLNAQLFVGGSWYTGMYHSEDSRRPVIINNNFVSGTERKKSRALVFGHWFLKEDNRTCDIPTVRKALRYEFKRLPGKWWVDDQQKAESGTSAPAI